jgi:hypothetical protein
VIGAKGEDLENQKVEGALKKVGLGQGASCRSSMGTMSQRTIEGQQENEALQRRSATKRHGLPPPHFIWPPRDTARKRWVLARECEEVGGRRA